MSTAIQRIRKLLNSLPKSDQTLGEQFIQIRDFESLKDLVDSAIYITKKNIRGEHARQEYLEVDLAELGKLKAEVDLYLDKLLVPVNEGEGDLETGSLNKEYYDEYFEE